MSLLSNKVDAIKGRSTKAIAVFQKTVSDLYKVNDDADKEISSRAIKIGKLQGEQEELIAVKEQNTRFINKLNEFLGLE